MELNRTDNLLAHERFANKREVAPIARVDSYAGLNTQQKNLKRARKLGIKMIPGLSDAISESKDKQRQSFVRDELVDSDQENDQDVSESDILTQIPNPTHLNPEPTAHPSSPGLLSPSPGHPAPVLRGRSPPSAGHPTPVPRPRTRIRTSSGDSPQHVSNPGTISAPVPTPRKRSPRSKDNSPRHLEVSKSNPIPGMTETQLLLPESPQYTNDVPHYKLPVRGAKALPESGDTSSGSSMSSLEEGQPQIKPIPKPRKSPTPSPRHGKRSLPSPDHVLPGDTSSSAVVESKHSLRRPLLSKDSGEISLDFVSDQSAPSSIKRSSLMVPKSSEGVEESNLDFQSGPNLVNRAHYKEIEESVLDFIPNGVSQQQSDHVPDVSQLEYTSQNSPRHLMKNQDSELAAEDLYDRRPSMATNLANLRILANSLGNLLEEDGSSHNKRLSTASTSSALSDVSPRTSIFSEQPPQVCWDDLKKGHWHTTQC